MQSISILGCGTMGEAILAGLANVGSEARVVAVSARTPERAKLLAELHGVVASTNNAEIAASADVVIVCTKPQVALEVLGDPEVGRALTGKVLISICAGVTTEQLAAVVPGASIVRAMPNTPCLIGEGMTVLCAGPRATSDQMDFARRVFLTVGRCRILDEKHIDAVTGLSGSGPAFLCVIIEALADGGVRMGLPRDVAIELAAQTAQGAARMVLTTGRHPAALKDEVTTPAGCTIAGLLTMEDGRIRSTLARTIEEATRTASGLGKVG